MYVRCVRVQRLATMLQEAAAEPPAHPWRAAEYPQPYGHSKANGHAPHCIGGEPHFLSAWWILGSVESDEECLSDLLQISTNLFLLTALVH